MMIFHGGTKMKLDEEDDRLYLQFLQNNIARMNTNSVQAKTWCIAIVAALLAIFAETKNTIFLFICLIPIILFCILDARYLQFEHMFVYMYNAFTKDEDDKPKVYEISMKKYEKGIKGYLKAFTSWSVWLPYGLMLISIIASMILFSPKKEKFVSVESILEYVHENDTIEKPELILKPAD